MAGGALPAGAGDDFGGWPSELFDDGEEARAESLQLVCPVCKFVMRDPASLPCSNEHALCWTCAEGVLRESGFPFQFEYQRAQLKCPVCREVVAQERICRSAFRARLVNDLRARCPTRDCGWRGSPVEVHTHAAACAVRQNRCATLMQSVVRMHLRREVYIAMRAAATKIQSAVRRRKQRTRYERNVGFLRRNMQLEAELAVLRQRLDAAAQTAGEEAARRGEAERQAAAARAEVQSMWRRLEVAEKRAGEEAARRVEAEGRAAGAEARLRRFVAQLDVLKHRSLWGTIELAEDVQRRAQGHAEEARAEANALRRKLRDQEALLEAMQAKLDRKLHEETGGHAEATPAAAAAELDGRDPVAELEAARQEAQETNESLLDQIAYFEVEAERREADTALLRAALDAALSAPARELAAQEREEAAAVRAEADGLREELGAQATRLARYRRITEESLALARPQLRRALESIEGAVAGSGAAVAALELKLRPSSEASPPPPNLAAAIATAPAGAGRHGELERVEGELRAVREQLARVEGAAGELRACVLAERALALEVAADEARQREAALEARVRDAELRAERHRVKAARSASAFEQLRAFCDRQRAEAAAAAERNAALEKLVQDYRERTTSLQREVSVLKQGLGLGGGGGRVVIPLRGGGGAPRPRAQPSERQAGAAQLPGNGDLLDRWTSQVRPAPVSPSPFRDPPAPRPPGETEPGVDAEPSQALEGADESNLVQA
eukprot:tig00020964_g16802.t1